jgi:hypothetical protein
MKLFIRNVRNALKKMLIKNFWKDKRTCDGLMWRCKNCESTYQRKYWKNNREKMLERKRPKYRQYDLMGTYRITIEEWNSLFESQGRVCAICSTDKSGGRNWNLDHDHKTKKNRAILCAHCNLMLGHSLDNPEILDRAAEYLRKHQNQ